MKKKNFWQELKKNKYKYLFLITIIILGFLSGIVLANILSYNDKKEVGEIVETYFLNLKNNESINYIGNFLNNLGVNFFYLLLLFIFGISIIGIVLNPFILYFKSLITGFSVGIIISLYSFKGILGGILYLFPTQLLNLLIYMLVSFYGINLSIRLFKVLFLRKNINNNEFMKKYFQVLLFSSIVLLISTLYETSLAFSSVIPVKPNSFKA